MKHGDWLNHAATLRPKTPALVAGSEVHDFSELDRRCGVAAGFLRAAGIENGQVVAIPARRNVETVIGMLAAVRAGASVLPLDPRNPDPVNAALVLEAGAVPLPGLEGLDEGGPVIAPREADPADVLSVLGTGGSSGRPRAVRLTFGNHFMSAVGSALNLGVEAEDRWICATPLSHVSGLAIVIRSLIYGTGTVLLDRFTPEAFAEAIEDGRATLASLVPTMLLRLLEADVPPGSLRAVLVGGAATDPDLIARARESGYPVRATYGLTEACSQVATEGPEEGGLFPLQTAQVSIEGEEILVRGPTVAPGEVDRDGWLRTGDRGRIGSRGELLVEGRIDDVIITGGENVLPSEITEVLESDPLVGEAIVVGLPDREWGSEIVALVTASSDEDPDPAGLSVECATRLGPVRAPKRIRVVEELPIRDTGKPDRKAIAELFGKGEETGPPSGP